MITSLAPLVGQPILNAADFELRVDHSKFYLEGHPAPLIYMIWKIVRFVDDRIHLQQAAGSTKVGYNAFYEHEMAQINGAHHFSGSKADREYWSQNTRDANKDIIKIKSHEKLLAGSGQAPSRNESGSAAQDRNSLKGLSMARRNKKQRLTYKKQQKAKKAQNKQNQPKASAAPAPVKSDS